MANDPIAEIDMSVPEHFHRAVCLALDSTDATGWCEYETAWIHEYAGTSPKLWAAYREDESPGPLVCAVTGNGLRARQMPSSTPLLARSCLG